MRLLVECIGIQLVNESYFFISSTCFTIIRLHKEALIEMKRSLLSEDYSKVFQRREVLSSTKSFLRENMFMPLVHRGFICVVFESSANQKIF